MNREYQIQNNCDVYCPVCSFPLGPRGVARDAVPHQLWQGRRVLTDACPDKDDRDDAVVDLFTDRDELLFSWDRSWDLDDVVPVNEGLTSVDEFILLHECCYAAMAREFGSDVDVCDAIVDTLGPSPLIGAHRDTFQWSWPGVASAMADFEGWVDSRVTQPRAPDALVTFVCTVVKYGKFTTESWNHSCDVCKTGDMWYGMYSFRAVDVCTKCLRRYASKHTSMWLATIHAT